MIETKICTKCGRQLPITDFYWRDKAAGRRRSECKDCHNGYVKQKYAERQSEIAEFKESLKCAKCGDSRSYVLDFHHVDPKEKVERISRMLAQNVSQEKLEEELKNVFVFVQIVIENFIILKKQKI